MYSYNNFSNEFKGNTLCKRKCNTLLFANKEFIPSLCSSHLPSEEGTIYIRILPYTAIPKPRSLQLTFPIDSSTFSHSSFWISSPQITGLDVNLISRMSNTILNQCLVVVKTRSACYYNIHTHTHVKNHVFYLFIHSYIYIRGNRKIFYFLLQYVKQNYVTMYTIEKSRVAKRIGLMFN